MHRIIKEFIQGFVSQFKYFPTPSAHELGWVFGFVVVITIITCFIMGIIIGIQSLRGI